MAEFPTTLNRVILHTVMHHSSTSTYIPNVIEIEETLGTDGHLRPTLLGRLREVNLKINPVRGRTVDSSQLTLVPTSKSRNTN